MKRNYDSGTFDNVEFFFGTEVEHTPAFGLETLFVVGIQDCSVIASNISRGRAPIKHIFFGANHSFHSISYDKKNSWEEMIKFFLNKDYLCSLDIPIDCVERFLESSLNEYNNFIPQIRVPIPFIKQWNYNTMIKLDDRGFNSSNPGVWTHSLHSLMDRTVFTDWQQYNNDSLNEN